MARVRRTSLDVWQSIQPYLSSMRWRAFELVCEAGDEGITCEEAEHKTGSKHQSMSPRFTDLANDDPTDPYRPHWPENIPLIVPSGRFRLTQSGYEAIVWIVNPAWLEYRRTFLERLDDVQEIVERRRGISAAPA